MWARPTSQSLFFSTLLGRVQFRDTSFVDKMIENASLSFDAPYYF